MKILLSLFTVALVPLASGQVLYNEAVSPDFSSEPAGTDAGELSLGSNLVIGSATPSGADGVDVFFFTVPVGLTLDAVTLDAYAITNGSNGTDGSFFAFESGFGVATTDPDSPDAAFLGIASLDTDDIGVDLLPELNAGGTGFTTPLPADVYTFILREDDGTFDYTIDFQTSAVPEPSTGILCALGLLGCFRRRR